MTVISMLFCTSVPNFIEIGPCTLGGAMTLYRFFAKKSKGPKFADPSMSAYSPVNLTGL